jgi:hypothetical protein
MDSEPSFMAAHLLECLSAAMTPELKEEVAPYRTRAARLGTDPRAEWQRAFACARWAVSVAAPPEHGHLAHLISTSQEAVRLFGDAVASEAGLLVPEAGWRVSPQFAAEIAWVDEACRLAGELAENHGWEAVPWRGLLDSVLSVPEPGPQPA